MEQTINEMPHNGNKLENYIRESGKRPTVLSREMGYSSPLLMRFFNTPSIRTHIWWKLGLLIDRNIFAEFAEIYPVKYKSKREEQLETELADVKKELEAELADVKKELEIYKRIYDKR